ncbi:MAG TPA: type I asparaginase [Williamwhitmania sp.]|nr:type I asparaginase [Williamwhitmania sp.]
MEGSTASSILVIYTGGTIGMKHNPETGSLAPFNFEQIEEEVPELKKFGFKIETVSFSPLVDSSNIQPDFWVRLVEIVSSNYHHYDGFVILHGTDTMSYTASALSFMIQNLDKPIILTGSQLPIGTLRTDGKENLVSAIEIAAARKNGQPLVPEVCVFFENRLFRGNRTIKHNADHFNAFRSDNYPPLAEAGINIRYNHAYISYPTGLRELKTYTNLDTNIAILKIFPGITPAVVDGVLSISGLKAAILETFGSGNAPTSPWFLERVGQAVEQGIVVLNVTQCHAGSVDMEKYDTGILLKKIGVRSGYDITTEAAVAKLMFLLGQNLTAEEIKQQLDKSISGEISE